MPQPLIGITTHPTDAPDRASLDALLAAIVRGVERASGLPLLIPLDLDERAIAGLAERLDGVLFSGGGDIDPSRYGAAPHPAVAGVSAARDGLELALARATIAAHRPLFGICRGAQVLNVALGGTLYRAIEEHPGAERHTFYPDLPFDLLAHPVRVGEGTLLERIVGRAELRVNSLHHQAVRELAPRLRPVAWSADGIVEALELDDYRFGLAVQWHPEALPERPEMRALFAAFVAACDEAR